MAIDCLQTIYLSADNWAVEWVIGLAGQVNTELPQCTALWGGVQVGRQLD